MWPLPSLSLARIIYFLAFPIMDSGFSAQTQTLRTRTRNLTQKTQLSKFGRITFLRNYLAQDTLSTCAVFTCIFSPPSLSQVSWREVLGEKPSTYSLTVCFTLQIQINIQIIIQIYIQIQMQIQTKKHSTYSLTVCFTLSWWKRCSKSQI